MTDKELLEAAAKAAGLHFEDGRQLNPKKYLVCPIGSNPIDCSRGWNPLTDDGDALRLAVKLTFEIDVCQTGIAVRTPIGLKVLVDSKQEPDAYAATRRAIVRAAAEMGEKL